MNVIGKILIGATVSQSKKKQKIIQKADKNKRSYADILNDPTTRGIDKAIEAKEVLDESLQKENDLIALQSIAKETGAIAAKFSIETITTFTTDLLSAIKTIAPKNIPIISITDSIFRTDDMSARYERGEMQNLARQLKDEKSLPSDAAIINPPVVYESDSKQLHCVSGWKRIRAAESIGAIEIGCRVVNYGTVHALLTKHQLHSEKNAALKASFSHIIYSESEHNSALSDMAIMSYFNEVKENHLLKREDFHSVLQLIGCNRKSPRYNDLYRLWKIVCQPEAYQLVRERKVKTGFFKKQTNIDIMYHRPAKRAAIVSKINDYIARARSRADKDKAAGYPIDLDTYEQSEVQKILLELDQPHLSKDQYAANYYRSPQKNVRVQGGKIEIQSFRINFEDKTDNSIRNIIETLFVLESVVKDLRNYASAFTTQDVNEFEKPVPPSTTGTAIDYGQGYFTFIRKYNLWDFCDLYKMSRYLSSKGDFPLTKDQLDAIDKLPKPERVKKLIQEFRNYGAIRDANAIKREHAEANATDNMVSDLAAPDLEALDESVEDDLPIPPPPKKSSGRKRSK